MSYEWVVQLAPSVAALGVAGFGLARGEGRLRRHIRHDVETANLLGEGSATYAALLEHVTWEVRELHRRETDGRRDWIGLANGVLFIAAAAYLTYFLYSQDHRWRWFSFVPAVGAATGLRLVIERIAGTRYKDDDELEFEAEDETGVALNPQDVGQDAPDR